MAADTPTKPTRPQLPERLRLCVAWLLVPELAFLLVCSMLVSVTGKRAMLVGAVGIILFILALSPVLPKGVLPFHGKWLRRALVGMALMGMAYAGPVSAIKKVWTYNWNVSQVQQGIVRYGESRPDTPLPVQLGHLPLPRAIGGLPMRGVMLVAGLMGGIQFVLLWRVLEGRER